jgi:hypothetical protein
MTITALGLDGLETLLRGNGRVTVANGGPGDSELVILAAVVVRHGSSGVASRQAILGLGLRSDEAKAIEPPEATDQLFDAVEVLLRIFTPGRLGLRDVYIATPPDAPPAGQWEVGVRADDGTTEAGEIVLAESPGLVAYLRALTQ